MSFPINSFLVDSDGTWDNTSLLCNGQPVDALRLRIQLKVHRDTWDRITTITCQHFILMNDGSQVGLLPGSVEVSVQGKGFVIANANLVAQQIGGGAEVYENDQTDIFGNYVGTTTEIFETPGDEVVTLDPNGYTVTYLNVMDTLTDPVLLWRDRNGYFAEDLLPVLDGAIIDFNYPEDSWHVAISLFKANTFRPDEVETIILGASPRGGQFDPFATE